MELHGVAEPMGPVWAEAEPSARGRVRRAAVTVPGVALTAGAAASVVDLRFGLLAAAVVLGWSQLVGL